MNRSREVKLDNMSCDEKTISSVNGEQQAHVVEGRVRAAAITQPEMHEDILRSAEKLFRTLGYLKVNIADIAKDMGMSPANVYRFFPSKSALREALVARLTGESEKQCWAIVDGQGSAEEKIEKLIEEAHKITMERYVSQANMSDMLKNAMYENWKIIDEHTENMRRMLEKLIREGAENGAFKVENPYAASRMAFLAMSKFMDPADSTRLFKDDGMMQVHKMCQFILGALESGRL